MSKQKLYAIKDTLVGFGGIGDAPDILNLPNDEVAIRVVKGSCSKGMKPNALNINAEYKELWCVGEFDRTTGTILHVLLIVSQRAKTM